MSRWIAHISRDARVVLAGVIDEYLKTDQLQDYRAYPKQLEFHHAGFRYRNRLLRAGNQNGKTMACGAEAAMHLTGEYPDWWRGKRFEHPITLWASSETGETTRDNCQRMLLGLPGRIGTGMIPKRCLTPMYGRSKGVAQLYDYYLIQHVSGGVSMLKFRYYAQDRETWQGPPVHVVWFDEEPPDDKYAEGLARTIAARGITMLSFTPLKGYSNVVNMYLNDKDPQSDRFDVHMTIHDALHISAEQREREIARWPVHERRARIMGEPALGEGRIFPFDEEDLLVKGFKIPDHWPQIAALDFGGASMQAHPTAAVKLAWDRDSDTVFVTKDYRKKGLTPPMHWLTLRMWGEHLKWAWPRDGLQTEKGTGVRLIQLYRAEGMKALAQFAQYPERNRKVRGGRKPGSINSAISLERGILDMYTRMESDRFKVFETCEAFMSEYRLYHREDGKIVGTFDDVMDACRYGIMSLRHAEVPAPTVFRRRDEQNWQLGI